MSGAEVSGDKKQDRAQIEQAARKIAGRDYPRFRAAVQYAKEYTALGSHAFGYAASGLLTPQYRLARDSQVHNLEDGLRRLGELVAGMTEVAYRMSVTEAANTIDLTKVRQVAVEKPPASDTGPAPSGGFGLRLLGTALQLLPTWQVPAALKSSFSRLMISGPTFTTMVSLSLWLGVLPDDDEISKVQSAWHSVATELELVVVLPYPRASMEEGLLPRSVWDDKARDAFDAWVEGFQLEVVQAGTEARQVVTALEDTLDNIREIQSMMSNYDWGTAGALFTLFVAGMVPAYTAPARAAQQIIAVLNGVATGITVGTLVTELGRYGSMMVGITTPGKFHKLTIYNDPGQKYGVDPVNDTFVDLDIDWLTSSS